MKKNQYLLSFVCLLFAISAAVLWPPQPAQAGIFNADTDVTYKEYWMPHSEFTGGFVEGSNCVNASAGNEFYLEPWPCQKEVKLTIPDDFSQALKIEVFINLWRNHNEKVASFRINGGPLHTPNVGYDWSRTPYVAEISKNEFVTGQNTFTFPAASAGYHIHDIAVRIYFDAGHPLKAGGNPISAPGGSLTTVSDGTTSFGAGAGGVLNVNNDQVTLTAVTTTNAKFVEFHGYYDGYDEDNDGRTRDWHNLGRNNWYTGGTDPKPTGGTIDHIGTVLAATPGAYNTTWNLPHITNQSGVKFKIRIVADGPANSNSYVVREAAGGVSGAFTLKRTRRVVAFTNPAFTDLVLHHSHNPAANAGQFPDTATRELTIDENPGAFNTAYVIGAYWMEPTISVNDNAPYFAFDGDDVWTLSIKAKPISWFKQDVNTFTYGWTGGFGQFAERPGPMVVLKQTSGSATDSSAPTIAGQDPAPNATNVNLKKNIVLRVTDSGLGVDIASIQMKVNNTTVNPTITGFSDEYTLTYDPPADFAPNSAVTVVINAKDLAGNTMPQATYSFQTSPPDGEAPLISNAACIAGSTSVNILWTTNEPATSKVEYGLTTSYGSQVTDNVLKTAHTATVNNLTQGQVINYKITATDEANNAASSANLTCAPTGSQSVLSDDFNRCALNTALWKVYDPQTGTAGQSTIRATGTTIEIDMPGGIDHDIWRGGATAPHIMQPISNTNFLVESKFNSLLTQKYQMLGLLVRQDASNFIRINFQNEGPNQTKLWVFKFEAGEPAIFVDQSIPAKQEPLYLRLDRNGTQWEIAYRYESDASFTGGGAYRFTHTMNVTELGFFAGNAGDVSTGSPAPAHKAIIDYFFNDAARISPEDATALYLNGLGVSPATTGIASSVPVSPTVGAPTTCGNPIRLTATAKPGWSFDRWTSAKGSVSGTSNPLVSSFTASEVVTATFKQDQYTLNKSVVGKGAIEATPLKATYLYSDVVTLKAVPAIGWSFAGWSGAATGSNATTSLTMTGNVTVVATFTQDQYSLTVHTTGDGSGTTTVNPLQNTYVYSDVVTLSAQPAAGSLFIGWSGGLVSNQASDTLTIRGNTVVTATFAKGQYTLAVDIVSNGVGGNSEAGGAVSVTPSKAAYTYDEQVTLSATPKAGWTFIGWSGGASGAAASTTVTMRKNETVTATFTQNQYTLTRNTGGQGKGAIKVTPERATYVHGEVLTIEAIAEPGSVLTGWSGALSGATPTMQLTITGNSSVLAVFGLREYQIEVTVIGGQGGAAGGTVTISPAGPYHYGDKVTLTAIPDDGYRFSHWTSEPLAETDRMFDLDEPTTPVLEITVDDDLLYNAHFERLDAPKIFLPLINRQ